jgi:hypothetical protein
MFSRSNLIDCKGIKGLCKVFSSKKKMISLSLNFSKNNINDDGMNSIEEMLKELIQLEELELILRF